MTGTTDKLLVTRTLEGERNAFGELVDRYQKVVYNVAYRVVGNEPDAEDVAQTVFLKVYENLATYNPRYQFFSWLYRIAVNEAVNAKKRVRKSVELTEDSSLTRSTPLDGAMAVDVENQIGAAMMSLTPESRAILILRHYQEFTYRDIAYIMDLTEQKVKSRLYSARQRLGKILIQKGLKTEL
ncbi:MAG: sigma-70 family RNA polymerase sigma factor [Bacteroidetes bacterium]|nr:sigma-70 family RNA polymerase sigma factor [Bacteroidota bacterium]